jgi:deazaflavin-dependent oxidoreductase (nitroreductase family)
MLRHPDAASVEISGTQVRVTARVVVGDERERLWERVNDNYNGYATYQARAVGRTIPVVVLERPPIFRSSGRVLCTPCRTGSASAG